MIYRRHAIGLGLAALLPSAWLCQTSVAGADQGYARFFPLLVDLPGWIGEKPDGIFLDMPGDSTIITALREYTRGDARLTTQVLTGPPAQGALATTKIGMRIGTAETRVSTSLIEGFAVTETYAVSKKSGTITIALGPSALFSFTFNGVDEDEALALAEKFNWKALQAQVK